MGKVRARLRELRGRMMEADGIALGNERLKQEGRQRRAGSRSQTTDDKARGSHRDHDYDKHAP